MLRLTTPTRDAEFTEFVQRSSDGLLRMAYALTADRDAAHDLLQTALLKAYVNWGRIRTNEASAYVRRIIVNQRIDTWRSTRREVTVDDLAGVADSTTPRSRASEEAASDHRDHLVRLLQRLPEQQRKVVVLRYYADLSEAAVADMLGITVGSVKSAASRGLAAVRAAEKNAAEDNHADKNAAVEKTAAPSVAPKDNPAVSRLMSVVEGGAR